MSIEVHAGPSDECLACGGTHIEPPLVMGNYGNDAPSIPVAGIAILLAFALIGVLLIVVGISPK